MSSKMPFLSPRYRLNLGTYSGTIGENVYVGLTYSNNMQFTTKDNDNDQSPRGNCAVGHHGAWWYKYCHRANLNGRWLDTSPGLKGVTWCRGKDDVVYPWFTEMKIRKVE